MTTATFTTHPKTGLPVQETPAFAVGDLVTERFLGDAYPAVVVAATAKTVWVASVEYAVGNVSANDIPGWNGYGDSATLVVDPESVEQALAAGKDGAVKYALRVAARPSNSMSINERERYGSDSVHRAGWRRVNSTAGYLTAGARYRRDPHV